MSSLLPHFSNGETEAELGLAPSSQAPGSLSSPEAAPQLQQSLPLCAGLEKRGGRGGTPGLQNSQKSRRWGQVKSRPNTSAKCKSRGVDTAPWGQGPGGQGGDSPELSSEAHRQPGVWGRGKRTFWQREQCVESKAQRLELSTAGVMSSGGAGFQGRGSVSSERQVSPQQGSQARLWTGQESIDRCQHLVVSEKAGRVAANQLQDCTFGPMKLLLSPHS